MKREQTLRRRINLLTWLFIAGLFLSGVTAIPLQGELNLLVKFSGSNGGSSEMARWFLRIRDALAQTQAEHAFLFYGTDWLAFAHIIIAVFFIGPFIDPVRNVWVIKAGLIACGLVVPPAIVCGAVRGIPVGWRLIDCSFGVIGAVPLYYCLRLTKTLEKLPPTQQLR